MIEWIRPGVSAADARVALFDFDGTISLIRSGWVDVMVPMMVEILVELKTGESEKELHDIVNEFAVTAYLSLVAEALRNNEMEVAILGVSEEDCIVVAMLVENDSQVHGGVCEAIHWKCNVFDDDGGSTFAHRSDRGKHPLADFP